MHYNNFKHNKTHVALLTCYDIKKQQKSYMYAADIEANINNIHEKVY